MAPASSNVVICTEAPRSRWSSSLRWLVGAGALSVLFGAGTGHAANASSSDGAVDSARAGAVDSARAPAMLAKPNQFSRAAVAMCQLGCDEMSNDAIRATCKLECFKDPTTAAPTRGKAQPASATGPSSQPKATQPKATQPTSSGSSAAASSSANPSQGTPSRASQSGNRATVTTETHGGVPAKDAAQCRNACDAKTYLSETDRATCRLGCDTKGPSVSTWTVTGTPAEVRCAKKCHCEQSCGDEVQSCQRSCNTMANANDRASCSLQCKNKLSPCQKACKPEAPTPGCTCG